MKYIAFAIVIALVCFARADAVVVTGTNIVIGGPYTDQAPNWNNYDGTVYQNVAGTDPTQVLFRFVSGHLGITTFTVDQGSDWYFVQPGVQFGPAQIAANLFTAVPYTFPAPPYTSPPSPGYPIGNGDFYLGVATSDLPNPPFTRNIFGWIQIHDVGGVLSAGNNAVSYHSQGIIVGTSTEIPAPEPSTIMLVGSALAVLIGYAWRRRKPEAWLFV